MQIQGFVDYFIGDEQIRADAGDRHGEGGEGASIIEIAEPNTLDLIAYRFALDAQALDGQQFTIVIGRSDGQLTIWALIDGLQVGLEADQGGSNCTTPAEQSAGVVVCVLAVTQRGRGASFSVAQRLDEGNQDADDGQEDLYSIGCQHASE